MPVQPNIIILGATSLIGPWIMKRLMRIGLSGQCYSRTQISFTGGDRFTWQELDITIPARFRPQPQSIIISLLPLWQLPALLPQLQKCKQVIAFSTTSIFGKSDSPDSEEQKLIRSIKAAENEIEYILSEYKIPWTILRPTLIYDGRNDRNVTAIAQFIQKWRVLPVAGPANGLRQPVHADDLAAAAVVVIENPSSYNRSFNLGGGEILTYRQMVQQIFKALGKRSLILSLPPELVCIICRLLKLVIKTGPNAAMFMRMNQDLIYDLTNARQALNYRPRLFQPDF